MVPYSGTITFIYMSAYELDTGMSLPPRNQNPSKYAEHFIDVLDSKMRHPKHNLLIFWRDKYVAILSLSSLC